ncbi:MAG TPA: hypothetical protein VET48_04855 [Steroidobacteraceae bacterium]|nr:hypothetical protein [Steroidobacteraceae bacterium]
MALQRFGRRDFLRAGGALALGAAGVSVNAEQRRMRTLVPNSYDASITRLDEGEFRGPRSRLSPTGSIDSPPPVRTLQTSLFLLLAPQIVVNANPYRVGLQIQNLDTTNPAFYSFGVQPNNTTAFTLFAGGAALYDFTTPTDILWAFCTSVSSVQIIVAEFSRAAPSRPAASAPQNIDNVAPSSSGMVVNYSGGGMGGGGYAGIPAQGTQMVWNPITQSYQAR